MADNILRLRVESSEYDNKTEGLSRRPYSLYLRVPQSRRNAGSGGEGNPEVCAELGAGVTKPSALPFRKTFSLNEIRWKP